jgi:uncharacterized protein YkwD
MDRLESAARGKRLGIRTMRPPLCVAAATLVVATLVPGVQARAPDLQPQAVVGASSLESDLIAALNSFRVASGLRPFRSSARLRAAARRHSGEMARYGYFEHASPYGAPFWRRIAAYYSMRGYRSWWVGENLEYGQPAIAAAEVLADWLRSPAHRANVVSTRWRDAGIGVLSVPSGPGVFGGVPTTIVTLDVGVRRR